MALGRISTNVINEGLKPESIPPELITGLNNEQTVEWTEKVETFFKLYAEDETADREKVHNFSTLQKIAHMESLIEGDILVTLEIDENTKLPSVKLISGRHVANGFNSDKIKGKNNTVEFGVELDKQRRHVAFHVLKKHENGRRGSEAVRVLARGKTTGLLKAWLLYESPPLPGKVRGFPILTRILQATDQIETYAVYEMEASKVNAALAAWVEKSKPGAGTQPLRGVTKRTVEDQTIDPTPKVYNQAGLIVHEVAYGEKLQSFKTDRPNVNFKDFKNAVLEDIAAALEIPPEILALKFGNNFSASRQAEIEFKTYVRKARKYFSDQFNKPIYHRWLMNMVTKGMIQAKGYLSAITNGDIFVRNGWQLSRWNGFVKQNVDILKEAKAYQIYKMMGWITGEQAAAELTETDFRSNVKRLKPENKSLADANEPLHGDINTSKSVVSGTNQQEEKPEDD